MAVARFLAADEDAVADAARARKRLKQEQQLQQGPPLQPGRGQDVLSASLGASGPIQPTPASEVVGGGTATGFSPHSR
jgi:hypothetical protein